MIELEKASVRYGQALALEEISVRIDFHEIVAIVGRNGAGKTTLLNILSGIVPPDRGSIRFEGRDVTGLAPYRIARAGLGRTFQNLKLFAGMSVLDNVKLGLHAHIPTGFLGSLLGRGGHAERAARDEALQILDWLGLKDKAQEIAGSLPYGVQRRLELARALATHPRLLLLDEPTLGLAPLIIAQIFEIIQEIRAQGVTVFLVEQNANRALSIADRGYVLETGRLVLEDTGANLLTNADVRKAYLGA